MKKTARFWLYPFIVMGFVLSLANGCNEEDTRMDSVITWENPADITCETLLSATQLNATANVSGTFVYTPAIGTKLSEGASQDLKVDFTPTDNRSYNTASKTVKINVTAKKDPLISWENPSDITYGSLLSATQLNATANVSGTFIYIPAIGTKLNAGDNQDLKVDFTPTDNINYNTVSKTVIINVKTVVSIFNPDLTYGTMIDIDGNEYKTITIGTQTWMAENLKTTKYRNGEPIPNVTDDSKWGRLSTDAYCNYKNLESNATIYGRLYNWYAVVDIRNIAPVGWHVPGADEWATLEDYLIANGYNYDGTMTDNKYAKAMASATGWESSKGIGAVGNADYPDKCNASGFSALPGGCSWEGDFTGIRFCGYWWTASENVDVLAFARKLDRSDNSEGRYYCNKRCGLSVRCIKDN